VEPYQAALCGSLAGAVAAGLTTPFDVVKTRILLPPKPPQAGAPYYQGRRTSLKRIYLEEGVAVLFSGILPRVMWISLGGAIFFGVYEKTRELLKLVTNTVESL
jgi:solute carrier family 25 S-adenosylmethionine transporter 26